MKSVELWLLFNYFFLRTQMKSHHLLTIPILISSLGANAEVTLDGSLGRSGALPGPDYLIGADLGRQMGSNLFHSFQDFNLNRFESATFSGPNSINNVISRVTGGNPSKIDGLIRSTIPADMYFLNPNGIMFGPNAGLDVQGSFHVSTADYLRLGDGGRFEARNPSNSILTVTPIESFGFLTNSPASITTQDSNLSVSDGNSLSLIGGNLRLNGNSPVRFDEQGFMAILARSKLSALAGRINLVSVGSQGEVIPSKFGLDLNADGGTITAKNSLIETSGPGGGAIFIQGGQLVMENSIIQSNTLADKNGKDIHLKLNENIHIRGNILAVSSKSFGQGDTGQIIIITPHLEIIESLINTTSINEGNARHIKVEVNQLKLKEGSSISSRNYGIGKGGNIEIQAKQQISLSGQSSENYRLDGLLFQQYPTIINSTTFGSGKGGQVTIVTGLLELEGGLIATASLGKGYAGNLMVDTNTAHFSHGGFISTNGMVEGQSGNIKFSVKDTLFITGKRSGFYIMPNGMVFENNQSGIATLTLGTNQTSQAGDIIISANTIQIENEGLITASNLGKSTTIGGNILITTKNLFITQNGQINNSNGIFMGKEFISGRGQAGTIAIEAQNISVVGIDGENNQTGIFSETYSDGHGGNIEIQTHLLNLSQKGNLSVHSHTTGNAGEITVQANIITLTNGGNIFTSATNAAGGNIIITIPHLIYLQEGKITTSVGAGKGGGGDITIKSPVFIISEQGQIRANADEGHGGNIHIVAEHFIKSPDSLVSASSRLGIDGKIRIDSPDVDISGALLVLPATFIDVSGQLKPPCSAQRRLNKNSFVVKHFTGGPSLPSDLQANILILVQSEDEKIPLQKTGDKKDDEQLVRKVAFVGGCQPASSKTTSSVIPEQLF